MRRHWVALVIGLCAISLAGPATAEDRELKYINALDLQVTGSRIRSTHADTAPSDWENGLGIGLQFNFYPHKTMLEGWNGFELKFRGGSYESLFLEGQIVAPWSIINHDYLEAAVGLGGKIVAFIDNPYYSYAAPTVSTRVGTGVGSMKLRVEYDYLLVVSGHQAGAFVTLPGGWGLGMELSSVTDDDDKTSYLNTSASIFYRFYDD